MKLKIKAYTIFEVVISMVIMSIISVIVFVLFSSFMKQLALYNDTNSKITSFSILKNNLKREVYLSQTISGKSNYIEINLNDSIAINYEFDENFIIKKMNKSIDTTFLNTSNYQTKMNKETNITQISFNCLLFGESIPLVLKKEYNSNHLINTSFNYEN